MRSAQTLRDKVLHSIETREAKLAILGLGYVGLPLALNFARAGFTVIGYDIDSVHVDELKAGRAPVMGVTHHDVQSGLDNGSLRPTNDPNDLSFVDVFIICVPSPLSKSRQPDMSFIASAVAAIQRRWRPGQTVILESTTYPGTTDEYLLPLFEETGAKLDRDFLLAFSPERVDPGNKQYELHQIPKVVGGASEDSAAVATALYATIFESVHVVSHARVAELSKLLENTFRNVNIALANEFEQICRELDTDVWEVIEAAATKPFGFMPFYPGPGIGGHCIPLDPQYLVYRARLSGYEPKLVTLADQINQDMPRYTVQNVMDLLNDQGKALRGSSVLAIGLSYKPNVPDMRESPAILVIEKLLERGADVTVWDPHALSVTIEDRFLATIPAITDAVLEAVDAAVILTAHDETPFDVLVKWRHKILDTRGVLGQFAKSSRELFATPYRAP